MINSCIKQNENGIDGCILKFLGQSPFEILAEDHTFLGKLNENVNKTEENTNS